MEPQNQSVPPLPKKEGGFGSIIGIIIIIILLALGAMYYFTDGIDQIQKNDSMSAEDEAMMLSEQSSSTNLADIEADVNATDLSGLDEASADFESELQAQ